MKTSFLSIVSLLSLISLATAQEQYRGEIEGADFIVDVPADPTGKVLFIARGFRPSFFPLSPVYEYDTDFYQTLLKEGWTIASTAFQTNDWVVAEGGNDILRLKSHIHSKIHPIKQSFLYGETMGGGVAVWLAENKPQHFAGVFALGAHLFSAPDTGDANESEIAPIFTSKPKLPILFVAGVDEATSSLTYAAASSSAEFSPVVWQIHRPGHVNVNSEERLAATRALVAWSEGKAATDISDATILMDPESTASIDERSACGSITGIRPLYGNIYTDLVASDLDAIGLALGDSFTFQSNGQNLPITYAKAYSDVPYGEWVAFIDPSGHVQVSRNYANAAETIDATKGVSICLNFE